MINPYLEKFKQFLKENDAYEKFESNILKNKDIITNAYNCSDEEYLIENADIIDMAIQVFTYGREEVPILKEFTEEYTFISTNFDWEKSLEGESYWNDLNNKWEKYAKENLSL